MSATDYFLPEINNNDPDTKLDEWGLLDVRDDFFRILSAAPDRVDELADVFRNGGINGGRYTGPCCCLIGSIARLLDEHYTAIPGVEPDLESLAERFVFNIEEGDQPRNNRYSAMCVEWCEEFLRDADAGTEVSQ